MKVLKKVLPVLAVITVLCILAFYSGRDVPGDTSSESAPPAVSEVPEPVEEMPDSSFSPDSMSTNEGSPTDEAEAEGPAEEETAEAAGEPVPVQEAPDPRPTAHELDYYVLVDNIYTYAPTDGSIYSHQRFEANAVMEIIRETDEPIGSVYLLWDEAPGSFSLSVDGDVIEFDNETILHRYIELPNPGREVKLITPAWSTVLCDIYVFSEGKAPSWVQDWQIIGDGEFADLLLFPTHSDDEFLFFGGIIPYYAGELGLKVQVAYMNRYLGDYSFRTHELLDALWTAGDTYYPVINPQDDIKIDDLDDTAEWYGYDNFTGFQVEQLRRFRPLAVVGHDFDGEYGHMTHAFSALCLADAVKLASDPEEYPESAEKYGVWKTPKLYIHLWPVDEILLDFETPLDAFDGMTAYDVAEAAFDKYLSQQSSYPGLYGSESPYDCHRFGLYRSTVGPDSGTGSLLENTAGIR